MKSDRTYILKSYTQKHRSFPIDLTETGKWELLSPSARLIFYSMWNSTKTNTAGIFRGTIITLRYITRIRTNRRISDALVELEEADLIFRLPEGGFYLPDWFQINCSSQEFVISAITDLHKNWPSFVEKFISDHNRKILKYKDHPSLKQYLPLASDIQPSDFQPPVSRYAVTDVNTQRGNQNTYFQEVTQRVRNNIESGIREEFGRDVALLEREDLCDDDAMQLLSRFGLPSDDLEEILCSRSDCWIPHEGGKKS